MRKTKIHVLVAGYVGNWLMVKGFDVVIYPAAMLYLGILWGWIAMTWASLLLCLLTLKFYDWAKQDWLGIEAIKTTRENTQGIMGRFLRAGDWPAFLFLSIKFDPLITMLYLRRGSYQYNGMNGRDWQIFIASLVLSNLYWGLIVLAGINVVQFVLRVIGVSS